MAAYFLEPDGRPKAVGTLLKNPALAAVLKRIANEGSDALYKGRPGNRRRRQWQRQPRQPVTGRPAGLPGQGTYADLLRLQAMEALRHAATLLRCDRHRADLRHLAGAGSAQQTLGTPGAVKTTTAAGLEPRPEAVHLIAEAERLAYADRGLYVADSDFVPVPVAGLIDPAYQAERARLPSPPIARRCASPLRRSSRWTTRAARCP